MKVQLHTVCGTVTIEGDADAIRHVVEADVRGHMALNRESYDPEDNPDNLEIRARIDQALFDHTFFDNMPYEQINLFLENDLLWRDGFGNRTHEIEVLEP